MLCSWALPAVTSWRHYTQTPDRLVRVCALIKDAQRKACARTNKQGTSLGQPQHLHGLSGLWPCLLPSTVPGAWPKPCQRPAMLAPSSCRGLLA